MYSTETSVLIESANMYFVSLQHAVRGGQKLHRGWVQPVRTETPLHQLSGMPRHHP